MLLLLLFSLSSSSSIIMNFFFPLILYRYRKDGMVYDPEHTNGLMATPGDTDDINKQVIVKRLLSNSYTVPTGTYDQREEVKCPCPTCGD